MDKNQLAKEGSKRVSPVTVTALTTIVDRQFKEDRTLCPSGTNWIAAILDPYCLYPLKKTYLRHLTHYPPFLVKTNYTSMLQTSRSTRLRSGPGEGS